MQVHLPEACDQGDCNCSMLCSRTTVSFCEVDECRCCNEKQKNSDFHYWENAAFNRLHFIGTFQSIAFFQEKYSGKDSSNKSDQTKDGVEIAASQTKDHAEWAAKEHQAADHNEHSDHKTGNRCGAASWLKFFGCKSKNAGAKYQSYNFRADVLNRSCTVESSAPEVSRRKQAMQKPIFAGFPKYTRATAMIPMMTPAPMIMGVSFFDNVSFILFPP